MYSSIERLIQLATDTLLKQVRRFGYCIKMGSDTDSARPISHDGLGLLMIHEGSCRFTGTHWNGTLVPGTGVIFHNCMPHRTTYLGKRNVRTVLHFSRTIIPSSTYHKLFPDSTEGNHRTLLIKFQCFDAEIRFRWAVSHLNALLKRPSSPSAIMHLFGLILSEVEPNNAKNLLPTVLQNAVQYMKAHIDGDETISELAAIVYCSESHLRRLFDRYLQYSPREYWLRLKVDEACRLLHTGLHVREVVRAVGFHSRRGFERAFQRLIGLAPAEYCSGNHDRTTVSYVIE